jgi:hypothetical protein
VKCIVRYDYVVEADNYMEAITKFVNDPCPEYVDYEVMEDLETVNISAEEIK